MSDAMRRFTMADIIPLLYGLEIKPGQNYLDAEQIDIHCPFCGHDGYHLNINLRKGQFVCPHCKTQGGVMRLYAYYTRGTSCDFDAIKRDIRKELTERIDRPTYGKQAAPARSGWKEIKPADDETLDRTYRALLRISGFALSEKHREALCSRGLSDQTIERNGYRTIPYEYQIQSSVWKKFMDTKLKEALKQPKYKNMQQKEIVYGRAVAQTLLEYGCQLKGVPGFFKIADRWCFRMVAGMLIPVRNHDGLIVGAQIRKDVGATKYLTLSSKGLDGAVNVEISRVHFPLANQNGCGYAVITEGPLKADVAAELGGGGCFISIPGVKATTPLEREYSWMKEHGITSIKNALDMDKLTNRNVREGSVQLTALLKKHGFKVSQLCWDEEYAKLKLEELLTLCKINEIEIPAQVTEAQRAGQIFNAVALAAKCLENEDIMHSVEILSDGTKRKHYWNDSSKGIDDYLLSTKAQKR